ncbi:MAG: DUF3667 domain-containing protein [Ferruginibacter sp.]|nr:DUF3667 domain-containing protein [Ferruginibacter sp.]
MAETCHNCSALITGNFCINCGQKKYKRIDKKYIWDELQYTLFHTNKGFLYSIKKILKNPGKTAMEFINGNRVNHYKPILLVFILSGIATFISYKLLKLKEVMNDYYTQKNINSSQMGDFMNFLANYTSIIILLLIPLFALSTWIAFKKWGHNYYEHLVINAYIQSFYTLITIIIFYPVMFVVRHSPNTFYLITQLLMLIVPLILFWFFKEFYKSKPIKSIVIKVLAVVGLTILGYLFFSILVVFISLVMFK